MVYTFNSGIFRTYLWPEAILCHRRRTIIITNRIKIESVYGVAILVSVMPTLLLWVTVASCQHLKLSMDHVVVSNIWNAQLRDFKVIFLWCIYFYLLCLTSTQSYYALTQELLNPICVNCTHQYLCVTYIVSYLLFLIFVYSHFSFVLNIALV